MKNTVIEKIALLLVAVLMLSLPGMAEAELNVVEEIQQEQEASLSAEIQVEPEAVEEAPEESGEVSLADMLLDQGEDSLPSDKEDAEALLSDKGTGNEETQSNAAAQIPDSIKLGVKQKYTIDASSLTGGKKAKFKSSKKSIASVDKKGVITAKKKGKATITITGGGKKATCVVKVVAAPKKVSFNVKTVEICIKETVELKPVITENTCASFTWAVKDNKIATVSNDGKVTGQKAGKTTVTVKTHNGLKASVTVSVKNAPEALGWKDFAAATSTMAKKNKGKMALAAAGSEYATARLIVKVKGELPDLSEFGVEAMIRDKENHYLIQLGNDREAEECANYLEGFPEVVYVEPDRSVESGGSARSNAETMPDAYWGYSATYAKTYAADLVKRGKTNTIVVAVVDSGVDYGHGLLKGRLQKGYDIYDNDSKAQDDCGHGTHVSGTIVLCTQGLNVKIMPIRVFNRSGGDDGTTTISMIVAAVNYAINEGADVINMSYGGSISRWEDETVNKAIKKGIVAVAAAGNENSDTKYFGPAHNKNCITVAAVDANKKRASFSNYGDAVDIAAPGVYVGSSVPGGMYEPKKGTSMATPFVSAAAAMLLLDNPGLSPSAVESKLRSAATDRGAKGWDKYFGAGFLNLKPFVQSAKQKYTVSYNANGGTGAPASQTKVEGTNLTLSATKPTKSYTVTFDQGTGANGTRKVSATFNKWNTKADGTGTSYNAGGTYSANASVTLYAQWTNGVIGTLPVLSRSGYNFLGWYTAATGGTAVSANTVVNRNMTVYARWAQNALSDWVEASQIPSGATVVESKTQYRYSDAWYSDWSGWSGWDINRQDTSDLKKEESATVWYWYRFVCPYCGAHMHVWDKCHTWAGGCGNKIGSENANVTWLTTPPSGGVQNWEGTGRIMLGSSSRDRWFFWKDASQGYPNGRSETGYRYATRTKNWGDWSGWSDSWVSSSDMRKVETRTLYRYRMQ